MENKKRKEMYNRDTEAKVKEKMRDERTEREGNLRLRKRKMEGGRSE